MQFQHMLSEIGAVEAEEVGVEHLLRDIYDASVSTLTTDIHQKLLSLRSLTNKLEDLSKYLDKVVDKKYSINHQIINHLQNIFNLLPNLNLQHLVDSFAIKTNDSMGAIYLSSLIRAIITFHNLILNRISHREQEKLAEEEERKKRRKKKMKMLLITWNNWQKNLEKVAQILAIYKIFYFICTIFTIYLDI